MNKPDNGSDSQLEHAGRNDHDDFYRDGNNASSEDVSAKSPVESSRRGLHHDLIAGVVIIAGASFLLTRATDMPPMSAVLPIAMLGALLVLSALMILRVLVRGRKGRPVAPRYHVFANRNRFFGTILSIALYTVGVSFIGFYTTTAVMIPVVAWCFGYRHIKRLLLADLIFTGGLAVIFVLLMGQELPAEFFIR